MAADTERDPSRDLWEEHANWWIDGFTDGADPEYEEQILPLAAGELGDARTILDIGCGDGQISRMMASVGATVIGIDPTWNQISVAHERGGGAHYARSTADELPFADASFDATVACLVFEHIDAVDAAIAEVARVTKPGGQIYITPVAGIFFPARGADKAGKGQVGGDAGAHAHGACRHQIEDETERAGPIPLRGAGRAPEEQERVAVILAADLTDST